MNDILNELRDTRAELDVGSPGSLGSPVQADGVAGWLPSVAADELWLLLAWRAAVITWCEHDDQ